jgi:hypothetical protein
MEGRAQARRRMRRVKQGCSAMVESRLAQPDGFSLAPACLRPRSSGGSAGRDSASRQGSRFAPLNRDGSAGHCPAGDGNNVRPASPAHGRGLYEAGMRPPPGREWQGCAAAKSGRNTQARRTRRTNRRPPLDNSPHPPPPMVLGLRAVRMRTDGRASAVAGTGWTKPRLAGDGNKGVNPRRMHPTRPNQVMLD